MYRSENDMRHPVSIVSRDRSKLLFSGGTSLRPKIFLCVLSSATVPVEPFVLDGVVEDDFPVEPVRVVGVSLDREYGVVEDDFPVEPVGVVGASLDRE